MLQHSKVLTFYSLKIWNWYQGTQVEPIISKQVDIHFH